MILQLGAFLEAVTPALANIGGRALNIGERFVSGLINRELTRAEVNAQTDAVKAAARAAANAISPIAAPGQTATFSGGPATGSAFIPPTLIPPGISPVNQSFGINPGLSIVQTAVTRPTPGARPLQVRGLREPVGIFDPRASARPIPQVQPAFFPQAAATIGRLFGAGRARLGELGRAFDPRTFTGRRMIGAAAGGVAAEAGAGFALDAILDPSVAVAPGRNGFPTSGPPLRIGGGMPPVTAPTPTGLPSVGRFQREPNGMRVQWFFFNGQDMEPITREQAACVKRECIFRLNVFTGSFVKLKSRRMNPMNVSAFFRAGRRVDSAERICRKMFSEKRKQKTGTVRRKTRRRKK